MWLTATSGTSSSQASVLAAVRPTSSEPTSPGCVMTPMAATFVERLAAALQRFVEAREDAFDVCSRCDFRDDSAPAAMEFVLAGDDVRQNVAIAVDDGDGRFIAGRLDREKDVASFR